MRQVNFTLVFVICLALVLFSLENTQLIRIKLIQGVELIAPLSVALVITLGVGAVFAWVFSVWVNFQSDLTTKDAISAKDTEIETLQVSLEQYKAELEERQRLLPSASSSSHQGEEASTTFPESSQHEATE